MCIGGKRCIMGATGHADSYCGLKCTSCFLDYAENRCQLFSVLHFCMCFSCGSFWEVIRKYFLCIAIGTQKDYEWNFANYHNSNKINVKIIWN